VLPSTSELGAEQLEGVDLVEERQWLAQSSRAMRRRTKVLPQEGSEAIRDTILNLPFDVPTSVTTP
jgi:hypothetical protein